MKLIIINDIALANADRLRELIAWWSDRKAWRQVAATWALHGFPERVDAYRRLYQADLPLQPRGNEKDRLEKLDRLSVMHRRLLDGWRELLILWRRATGTGLPRNPWAIRPERRPQLIEDLEHVAGRLTRPPRRRRHIQSKYVGIGDD